jgi:hypothetical protein
MEVSNALTYSSPIKITTVNFFMVAAIGDETGEEISVKVSSVLLKTIDPKLKYFGMGLKTNGHKAVKTLFSSSLMSRTNKLECLCLVGLFILVQHL